MATVYAVHDVDPGSAHYAHVRREMARRGAPTIRAVWHAGHGAWIALEGSHRLAAAYDLGLVPVIADATGTRRVTHDWDDYPSPADLTDPDDPLLGALVDTRRLNAEAVPYRFDDDEVPRGVVGYEQTVREGER